MAATTATPTLTLHVGHYPAGLTQPPHAHDELHLSLVLCGAVREDVESRAVDAGPLCVVIKDPGVVHADRFGPAGATLVSLRFRGPVDALLGDRPAARRWQWTRDTGVAARFVAVACRATGGVTRLRADDADLVALFAALRAARHHPPPGQVPAWLEGLMQRLQEEWRPGARVAALARRAGVHRVHLSRSVRRWYGHGVRDELRRLRLAAAVNALASAPTTISAVAHATGYADESHLCREFRGVLATTPGGYRGLVTGLQMFRAAAGRSTQIPG